MLVEHTTTPLSDVIIANTNYRLTNKQKSTINTIAQQMQSKDALASDVAQQICEYLKIPMHSNYQNLVDLISEHNRKAKN